MNSRQDNPTAAEQDAFEARLAKRLRDSADELDGHTRSRLNQARQAALDELQPKSAWRFRPVLAGAATAAVAVVAFFLLQPAPDTTQPLVPAGIAEADLELLMAEESLDMLEDLEFYTWLAEADLDNGSAG